MNIRPMNDTSTIAFSIPTIQAKKIDVAVKVDPSGTLPSTIYRVVKWESSRQILMMVLSGFITLAATIMIIVLATAYRAHPLAFIIPTILILLSIWKATVSLIERNGLKRAVKIYKEDLRAGLESTPPFLTKFYAALHRKQVAHNWFTFFSIFYGGILTILLWWLKDAHWWIFTFDQWIHAWFSNPDLMSWFFTGALMLVIVLHILLAIQRKKRALDIDSYLGTQIMSTLELEEIKSKYNRFYRRIFVISLLIILVVPIIVKLVLKVITRKR